MNHPEFAERLRAQMDKLRISQSKLAKRIKVSPTAVFNWENGKSLPRRTHLQALAEVLRVDEKWLTGGEGTEPEPEFEDDFESLDDEISKLEELVASHNGVAPERVRVRIYIG